MNQEKAVVPRGGFISRSTVELRRWRSPDSKLFHESLQTPSLLKVQGSTTFRILCVMQGCRLPSYEPARSLDSS